MTEKETDQETEAEKIAIDLGEETRIAAHRAIEDEDTRGFVVLAVGKSVEDTATLVAVEDDVDLYAFMHQSIVDLLAIMRKVFEKRARAFKNRHTEETS